jgi:hypothetical protein
MRTLTIYIFLLLLCICNSTHAQEHVWKKRVQRTIFFKDNAGAPLFQQITNAVLAGSIPIYKGGHYYNDPERVTPDYLKELLFHKPDTIYVEDPETGTKTIKVFPKDFINDSVKRYCSEEEWTYDLTNGQITAQILALAPVVNVYNEDGTYRQKRFMFWIQYGDIKPLLDSYATTSSKNLLDSFWFDFNYPVSLSNNNFSHLADLYKDPDSISQYDMSRHLKDNSPDNSFFTVFAHSVSGKRANVYRDSTLLKPITLKQFKDLLAYYDTFGNPVELVEINLHEPPIKVVKDVFNLDRINKFRVLDTRSFDRITGEVKVQIKCIAPVKPIYDVARETIGYIPLFWIKYSDISDIVKSDPYHPNTNILGDIWQSYFQTPEYVH